MIACLVSDKSKPGALLGAWVKAFIGPLAIPIIPRLFQIGFTYAQPFLITAAINLAATPQTQEFNNNGYGLIGAYFLVYTGIAVRDLLICICMKLGTLISVSLFRYLEPNMDGIIVVLWP